MYTFPEEFHAGIIIAAAEDILKVSASREKKHFQNDNFQSIDCTVFYDDSCEFTL